MGQRDQRVQEQLLHGAADDLHRALEEVRGCIELDLKVLWNEERLFAEIVTENDDIRALRDSLAGQSPEAPQYERIQLGERVAAALQRKSEAEPASLLDALEPLAVETRVNDNLSDMMLLIAAFLVDKSQEQAFDATVHALGEAPAGRQIFQYEVILDTAITGAGPDYTELEGGQRIPTHMLIWTAGVTPSPVIGTLDAEHGHHGGIVVDACCAVPGHPGVWALGDCAEVPRAGGQATYAPTAQNATREGTQVARNIVAVQQGQEPQPFVYTPIGELALVGRRAGVASLYGVPLSGLVAWALWRGIYLAKMPLLGKRVRIGFDWLLDVLFGREIVELPRARSTPRSQSAR